VAHPLAGYAAAAAGLRPRRLTGGSHVSGIGGLSDRIDQLGRDLRQDLREEIRSVVAAIEGRVERHERERHAT
jgi:hypothetical protein